MIVKVPESKIATPEQKLSFTHLNESFFDGCDDGSYDEDDYADDAAAVPAMIEAEKLRLPDVRKFLEYMDVLNYTAECTGHGIVVDVHDNLWLSNKGLREFSGFSFGSVDGDCDFAGNKFTDFKWFPRYIGGDCIANFNEIRDFSHAPHVMGTMMAQRQRCRTKYPLTDDVYHMYMRGELEERLVVDLLDGEAGLLESVDPALEVCMASMFNGEKRSIPADRADCPDFCIKNV